MGRVLSESVSSLKKKKTQKTALVSYFDAFFFHVFGHRCVIRVTF